MEQNNLISLLQHKLGTKIISIADNDIVTIEIAKSDIIEVFTLLKEDPELNFHFLTDLCGVHFPDQSGKEFGVTYHLHNFYSNIRLRVKAFTSEQDLNYPSLTVLYETSNWMERETFDFFGLIFTGHPNLKRILNVDEMTYHPLRKEYPLEDGTRTDKDDRFFGRTGNEEVTFEKLRHINYKK